MPLKEILSKIRQIAAPPLFDAEQEKRRATALYYLLVLLLFASIILTIPTFMRGFIFATRGLLVADVILIFSLILIRFGHTTPPRYIVPLGMLAVNTYIIYHGDGINDIAVTGMATIVALAGLLLGKRGPLAFAALSFLCLSGIYWAEKNGLTNAGPFAGYAEPGDIIIVGILLGITALLIFFAMNDLSLTSEIIGQSEQALRTANEELAHNAAILEHRTDQLLTGAKVSRAASSILEPDELCQQVVDMASSRFGLYYVGLFLLDEKNDWAVLHAGTGEAGQEMLKNNHRLKVGNTSMIGWCIANQKARIALDVGIEAVRFDNPLLPNTRSELALPLVSRGQIIGALGIQSDKEAAFSEEDIAIFQAMADQLANAIGNARLYHQLQHELAQRKRVEKKIRKLNAELEQRVTQRTSELQAANENLTVLGRLKDEFVANVSHELRTPITSIMLYHSMLEIKPQEAKQFVPHLKRETERLATLIEDLLTLTRLDQGRTQLTFNPVDLNRLVEEYVADRTLLAKQRKLTLTLENLAKPAQARADEKMIGQVLSILLTNALNYTPSSGKVTVRTLAGAGKDQGWAGFSVSDTGPGIAPEDRKRLFERFFRGKVGRASAMPGTGLGLAIAREIVHQHAGRIEVQSAGVPGEGTTFSVWLPAAH